MRIILALCLMATLLTAGSCTRAPASEPALWRLADADSEIWLFGTVHVLPANVTWRGPRVNAALDAAEEFVTETDMSSEATARIQVLAAQLGALPPGAQLSALLTAEDAARLAAAAQGMGIDPQRLESTRPWLAALQLSYTYAAAQGHSAEYGVETVLGAAARAQGKRLSFLETPEQQIGVLSNLTENAELHLLMQTVQQIEDDSGVLDAMDAAWARGDVDELARLLDAQWRDGGAEIHEAVILNRNRAWTNEIARRMEGSGTMFIAVGAAHLVGEGNVIALLRERGYSVEGP
jgi:uncharacterized protein